jgi:alkanesulfonate monooxygenase SsuD/methylene tetrahydromethanopterin reductase-like flavin-dependent oxidoreductase (luciferase family)
LARRQRSATRAGDSDLPAPALERVARDSNGWNPVGIPPAGVAQMFEGIKETARQAGRDPSELELVMRANVELTDTSLGDDRGPFCGTTEQIAADIAATKEIGATQLFFDPSFDPAVRSLDDYVGRMELCAGLAK